MTKTHDRQGYPMRRVEVGRPRAQTYAVTLNLECGHAYRMTISSRRVDDPKAYPKTRACWQCDPDPEKAGGDYERRSAERELASRGAK